MVMLAEVMVKIAATATVIAIAMAVSIVEAMTMAVMIDLKAVVAVVWAFCHDDA